MTAMESLTFVLFDMLLAAVIFLFEGLLLGAVILLFEGLSSSLLLPVS